MNKKDFLVSLLLNVVSILLIIEYIWGLELAFSCLILWTIISLLGHMYILRDYIYIKVEEIDE